MSQVTQAGAAPGQPVVTPTPKPKPEPVPPKEVANSEAQAPAGETAHSAANSQPTIDPAYFKNSLAAAQAADKNKDGALSKTEYEALRSESSGPDMMAFDEIPEQYRAGDKVSLDIAASAHEYSNDLAKFSRHELGAAVKDFKEQAFGEGGWDKDKSGTLTGDEFKQFADHYGIKQTFDEVANLATVGKNKDGKAMVTQSDAVLAVLNKGAEKPASPGAVTHAAAAAGASASPKETQAPAEALESKLTGAFEQLTSDLAQATPEQRPAVVAAAQQTLTALAKDAPAAEQTEILGMAAKLNGVPDALNAIPPEDAKDLFDVVEAYEGTRGEVERDLGRPAQPAEVYAKFRRDNESPSWDEKKMSLVANAVEQFKQTPDAPKDFAQFVKAATDDVLNQIHHEQAAAVVKDAMTKGPQWNTV